jgi:hypothetical protein
MCVVLRVACAPPIASGALATQLQAIGARRLDGRLVSILMCRRHSAGDEDRARGGNEEALRNGAQNEQLEVGPLVSTDHEKIGTQVIGELRELSRGAPTPHTDSDGLALEPVERLELLVDIAAKLGRESLRAFRACLFLDHVHNVKIATSNTARDPSRLIERETAGFGEIVADNERKCVRWV